MIKTKKKAFTLMELLVVVIIIGILSSLMFPGYQRAKERAIDRQARTILPMIRAAEREYCAETGHYYPPTGSPDVTSVANINSNLKLDITDDGTWNSYCVTDWNNFTASMYRNQGGFERMWEITADQVNATCSGDCP